MSFLIDTNVVSEARKPRGNPQVKAWLTRIRGEDLYISVLLLGELRRGIALLAGRDPEQAAVYERWLTRLRRDYADRILPVSAPVAEEWGRLNVPDPLPVVDGLLAATAKVHDLTLVTRDTTGFARTGVRLLNPFAGDSS